MKIKQLTLGVHVALFSYTGIAYAQPQLTEQTQPIISQLSANDQKLRAQSNHIQKQLNNLKSTTVTQQQIRRYNTILDQLIAENARLISINESMLEQMSILQTKIDELQTLNTTVNELYIQNGRNIEELKQLRQTADNFATLQTLHKEQQTKIQQLKGREDLLLVLFSLFLGLTTLGLLYWYYRQKRKMPDELLKKINVLLKKSQQSSKETMQAMYLKQEEAIDVWEQAIEKDIAEIQQLLKRYEVEHKLTTKTAPISHKQAHNKLSTGQNSNKQPLEVVENKLSHVANAIKHVDDLHQVAAIPLTEAEKISVKYDAKHIENIANQKDTVEDYLQSAFVNFKAEHYQESLKHVEKALQLLLATIPQDKYQVSQTLYNKALTLEKLNDKQQQLTTYDTIINDFAKTTIMDINIQKIVAKSFHQKAQLLLEQQKPALAANAYDTFYQTYQNSTDTVIQQHLCKALLNKADILQEINQKTAALNALDLLLSKYKHTTDGAISVTVAQATDNRRTLLHTINTQQPTPRQSLAPQQTQSPDDTPTKPNNKQNNVVNTPTTADLSADNWFELDVNTLTQHQTTSNTDPVVAAMTPQQNNQKKPDNTLLNTNLPTLAENSVNQTQPEALEKADYNHPTDDDSLTDEINFDLQLDVETIETLADDKPTETETETETDKLVLSKQASVTSSKIVSIADTETDDVIVDLDTVEPQATATVVATTTSPKGHASENSMAYSAVEQETQTPYSDNTAITTNKPTEPQTDTTDDLTEEQPTAQQLFDKAVSLGIQQNSQQAIATYQQLIDCYITDNSLDTNKLLAQAFDDQANHYLLLGDYRAALKSYDALTEKFRTQQNSFISNLVADSFIKASVIELVNDNHINAARIANSKAYFNDTANYHLTVSVLDVLRQAQRRGVDITLQSLTPKLSKQALALKQAEWQALVNWADNLSDIAAKERVEHILSLLQH